MASGDTSASPAVRLLHLIDRLSHDGDVTTASLADDLGVSQRTINRDLKLLDEAGLQLIRDRTSGSVRIQRDTFLPPIDLTIDEALTLIAIYGTLGDRDGIPGLTQFAVIAEKIAAALPKPMRETVDVLRRSLDVSLPEQSQPERSGVWYQLLQDAITRQRVVEIHYDSIWDNQAIVTRLSPAFLTFRKRAWYCIGFSSFHQQVRSFHVGRIIIARLSDKSFELAKELSATKYFGNAWNMIRGETRHEVRVRFAAKVARNVADVQWHHTQKVYWNADDSVELTFEIDGLDEISWWILGYGDHAEVLQPQELRNRMQRHAEALHARYVSEHGTKQPDEAVGQTATRE